MKPARPFVFDHIFKSVGTSVHRFLQDRCGREWVPDKIGQSHFSDMRDHLTQGRGVCAHLVLQPGDDQRIAGTYVTTVLRDPIERIISTYRFVAADFNAGSRYHDEARALSLEDYLFDRGEDSVRFHNAYVKRFGIAHSGFSGDMPPLGMLGLARETLDRYALVGTAAALEEYLRVLAADLGIEPPDRQYRENVNPATAPVEVSDALRARLREANDLDYRLMDHARQLFCDGLTRRLARSPVRAEFVAAPAPPAGEAPAIHAPRPGIVVDSGLGEMLRGAAFQDRNWLTLGIGRKSYLALTFRVNQPVVRANLFLQLRDEAGRTVYETSLQEQGYSVDLESAGDYCFYVAFPNRLGPGKYRVGAGIFDGEPFLGRCLAWRGDLVEFESCHLPQQDTWYGSVALDTRMHVYAASPGAACKISTIPHRLPSGRVDANALVAEAPLLAKRVFTFEDPALGSECGERREDGIYPLRAGYLIFGPYAQLLPGIYSLDLHIYPVDPRRHAAFTYDVSASAGQDVLVAPTPAKVDAKRMALHLDLILERAVADLEVRVLVGDDSNAAFRALEITQVL